MGGTGYSEPLNLTAPQNHMETCLKCSLLGHVSEFLLKDQLLNVWGFPCMMAQTVKHLSTMQETRVQSLGQEDPLEKEMAIHSSTIAWKISWTEEPGRLQSMRFSRQ